MAEPWSDFPGIPDLSEEQAKAKRRQERRESRRLNREQAERRRQHKAKKTLQMQQASTKSESSQRESPKLRFNADADLPHGFVADNPDVYYNEGLDQGFLGPTTERRPTFQCLCNDCLGSNRCTSDYRCMAVTHRKDGAEETTYGCINQATNFGVLSYCEASKHNKNVVRAICCEGELCNDVPPPRLPSTQSPVVTEASTTGSSFIHPTVFLAVPAVLCILLVILIILFIYKKMKTTKKKRKEKERIRHYLGDNLSAQPLTEDCSIELPDPTSGSGSGMPMLVQRTVAKSVTLVDQIGTGKYGNVYKGLYQGSPVAVKIFLSKDEASWARESEIYTTLLLRHENILGFMASDMISYDSVTQYWLLCHYHENGSLYDFLNQPYNAITPSQCLLMLYSASAGLAHLHAEFYGTQAKPAIAHRDIKSKNILVKEDGSCCIADLGLSVTDPKHESLTLNRVVDRPKNTKVGTKRYMAPEVLSENMKDDDFECYKRADIYSFSLVMWETAFCTIKDGRAHNYHLPYGGLVRNDPSFEEMRQVVVSERRRPGIPADWANHKIFNGMRKLIQECWSDAPAARLTILRIKKTLNNLLEESRDMKEYV